MRWLALLVMLGCAGEDAAPPAYLVQVDVMVPADTGDMGVTLRWADQAVANAVVGPRGFGVTSLQRGFATRDEALAFHGSFVVEVAGVEALRQEIDFADCDLVAELGFDPALRRMAAFRWGQDLDGTWAPGTHYAYQPEVSCLLDVGPADLLKPPFPPDRRQRVYELPLAAGVARFTVGGAPLEPRGIGRWGDHVLYELDIESAVAFAPEATSGELVVVLDAVPLGSYQTTFDHCLTLGTFDEPPRDPSDLRVQQVALTTAAGGLTEAPQSGFACGWADGSVEGVVP